MSDNNLIFEIKGKKYSIKLDNEAPNSSSSVNKLFIDYQKDKQAGDKIIFPRVLSMGDKFGKPYLEGTSVVGEVVKHRKLKKMIIFKYKAKKRNAKKRGCRPRYTEVKIVSVENN